MFIDSHSHLHFPVYKNDINAVLGRMKERNVVAITVGTSYKNSLDAVEFSKKYGIPCSVGFHPSHARPVGVAGHLDPTEEVQDEEFDGGKLCSVILNSIQPACRTGRDPEIKNKNKKTVIASDHRERGDLVHARENEIASQSLAMTKGRIVAIGECGLDYFRLPEEETLKKQFKQKQREAFEAQIALAQEFNLPLMIHTRASKENPNDAYQDALEILLTTHYSLPTPGVMHCFLGSKDWAKKFLDLGFMLSFSGIITFRNANTIRESARYCPKDLILTETDCPYLAPEPFRGERNEPAYVEFVLWKLEEIRGEPLEEVIEENTQRLFLLKHKDRSPPAVSNN